VAGNAIRTFDAAGSLICDCCQSGRAFETPAALFLVSSPTNPSFVGHLNIGPDVTLGASMRVRIFTDPVPAVVEERVNHWPEHELGNAEIIKTETTGVGI
jgi:hypothetical protein